jgi:hypothetical protein
LPRVPIKGLALGSGVMTAAFEAADKATRAINMSDAAIAAETDPAMRADLADQRAALSVLVDLVNILESGSGDLAALATALRELSGRPLGP